MIQPLALGTVSLNPPVILAPMAGVTDAPFRRLVKRFGAGLTVSEMIASQAAIRETRHSVRNAAACREETPLSVQIAGCDPEVMAEAARLCQDHGAALIDINFGCPVKKIVNGMAGAALMRDERRAALILEAVVKASTVPVTLKMRAGWNAENRNAPQIARIAQDCGVSMITVHGRTRCQFYQGHADWAFIAEVKSAVDLPVIANGDITTVDDAKTCLELSRADGVMIGRGSYGRPWFLKQVIHFLQSGERLADPCLADQFAVLTEHYDAMLDHYGVEAGVRIARKHLSWYSKGLHGSSGFRASINAIDDPDEARRRIAEFYRHALEKDAEKCAIGETEK